MNILKLRSAISDLQAERAQIQSQQRSRGEIERALRQQVADSATEAQARIDRSLARMARGEADRPMVVDAIGRTDRNGQVLKEQPTAFVYNANIATNPPDVRTATLTQLVATQEDSTSVTGSVGFRVSPVGNLLLTVNGLFSLNHRGLQQKFSPLVGIDYSF